MYMYKCILKNGELFQHTLQYCATTVCHLNLRLLHVCTQWSVHVCIIGVQCTCTCTCTCNLHNAVLTPFLHVHISIGPCTEVQHGLGRR